jgi:hypothetical protein
MSSTVGSVWETLWGLLVDDGQLAVGIVVSLAIVWAVATYGGESVRDLSGWLLLALLVALTLANLYRAGVNARRRVNAKGA